MPKHRDVPSLQDLSIKSIGSLVVHMAPSILSKIRVYNEPRKRNLSLQECLNWLNEMLVIYVPYYLYDTVAIEVFKSVKALIERTKEAFYPHTSRSECLTELNVVASLTGVVFNFQLKRIDSSEWPKIMRYVLCENLRMLGLESLNPDYRSSGSQASAPYDGYLLGGITALKNLKSLCLWYDCDDEIVQRVGEHCVDIQCLDLTFSRFVTERSIRFILKCKNLRELHLYRTSVSVEGLAQLIVDLPKLQDIGYCDRFESVINYLHGNYSSRSPFGLKKVQPCDLSTKDLKLFVKMFPKVECFTQFRVMQISDLTILASVDDLIELKLYSFELHGDYLKQLLEVKGNNIISLELLNVGGMDFRVLVDISQYCPKLKNLCICNCDFLNNSSFSTGRLRVQPFLNLEGISWAVDSAIGHLEFILTHAINIRYIEITSAIDMPHSTVVNLLNANPMQYLLEFQVRWSSDMNMKTVELLLASCPNVKVLSELQNWKGITMEEFETFKEYINSNNFDMDLDPF